jgi:hypothetical protein
MRRGIGQVLRDVLSDEDGVEAYFMTPAFARQTGRGKSWSRLRKPCGPMPKVISSAARSSRRTEGGGGRHERDCCHRSSSRSFSI